MRPQFPGLDLTINARARQGYMAAEIRYAAPGKERVRAADGTRLLPELTPGHVFARSDCVPCEGDSVAAPLQ